MYFLVSILIIVACILLILIILVQNSKGGGLASNFTGSNQVMGVRRTADFLEKATWGLAIGIFALTLLASVTINRGTVDVKRSMIEDQINSAVDPSQKNSNFPTTPPQNPTTQPAPVK